MSNKLIESVKPALSRAGLKIKKYSPEILLVTGIVAGVGTVALTIMATLKVKETIAACDKRIEEAGDDKKALKKAHRTNILAFTKLYGPAALTGAVSIASVLASHGIIKKRNLALMATCTSLTDAFAQYRERVKERLGDEEEEAIYHNTTKEENASEGPKNGSEGHPSEFNSPYSFLFDECNSRYWTKNPEYNRYLLMSTQRWANDVLYSQGHLFLNEVLDALGLERTSTGALVGWVRNGKGTDGDGFVSFGMFGEGDDVSKQEFMRGREPSIWLDFNVDGVIYNLI